jgi:hypothetical protein
MLLNARPVGDIKDSDFKYQESAKPAIGNGQILARNLYLSLDPAMRGWMRDMESYIEPVKVGEVMRGGTIAEVVESKAPGYEKGDKVFGLGGWQDFVAYGPGGLPGKLPANVPLPLTNFLSVLGITGMTAYFGFLDVCEPKAGETLVVSTAAGAVGSIVCQLGKIKGCRVVGLAGADDKCAWVTGDLGADVCINYKTQDVAKELRKACPKGVDMYFDNVGGAILNTVLGMLNVGARVSICGAISQYNDVTPPPGPSNYLRLLTHRSKMQGFIVTDYMPRFPEAMQQMGQWIGQGKIKHREDVVEGLENAPKAILKLFNGSNEGKLIVHIADPA